jgi:hypothetical protein
MLFQIHNNVHVNRLAFMKLCNLKFKYATSFSATFENEVKYFKCIFFYYKQKEILYFFKLHPQ